MPHNADSQAIALEPYKDAETSHSSSHLESPQDTLIGDDARTTLLPHQINPRKTRHPLWNPWNVGLAFMLAMVLSYMVGTYTAPRLPDWMKERMPNFLLADDVYETNPGFLPSNHPWTAIEGYTTLELPHACQFIPVKTYELLNTTQAPTIQIVAGNHTATVTSNLTAPVSVCVLVSIPQKPFRNGSYPDAPVPGKGPDTVHLYINSTDTISTFPPLLPLPDQPGASQQYFASNIIYFAEFPVFNSGTYIVHADQEFSNWRWAQEWHIESGTNRWIMVTGEPTGDAVVDHAYEPVSLPTASFVVNGHRHLPSRPLCDDIENAAQGRWYKYSSFPVLERELVDEWGYTWQGDTCHLDYYSPIEALECLKDKTIHLYGDSMVRRIAKTVMSGGKWCLDPYSQCQDEDDNESNAVPKLDIDKDGGIVVNQILREQHFQSADRSAITFGMNTSAYFTFLTALAGSSGSWMVPLYDEKDRFSTAADGGPADAMDIKPNATARPPTEMKPADLVILGFGAWDQAFTDRFDEYEASLTAFRDAFLQAYEGVPIILRLSNQWCCRGTHSLFRRYSGGRIQEFDARTRKVFRVNGGSAMDGRIAVLDPAMMNGRPDVIHDYHPSNANHPRASHVRIEMQMMMNSLCKKDMNGHATLRASHR